MLIELGFRVFFYLIYDHELSSIVKQTRISLTCLEVKLDLLTSRYTPF